MSRICCAHVPADSTETNRGHDNYVVSERDLQETYLSQYERAFVKGKASGAMCRQTLHFA